MTMPSFKSQACLDNHKFLTNRGKLQIKYNQIKLDQNLRRLERVFLVAIVFVKR